MEFNFDKFKEAISKIGKELPETLPDIISSVAQNKNAFPQCGSRPFFPGKRKKAYNECVQMAVRQSQANKSSSTTTQDFFKKNYIYLLGAAAIVGVVIYNKRQK